MRRISINGALFMFMKRGEKLTHDAIWNDAWGPQNRYVLWPRGEFWDVRFKNVEGRKLEWLQIADEPFANENEAWQAALTHWEKQPAFLRNTTELTTDRKSVY